MKKNTGKYTEYQHTELKLRASKSQKRNIKTTTKGKAVERNGQHARKNEKNRIFTHALEQITRTARHQKTREIPHKNKQKEHK